MRTTCALAILAFAAVPLGWGCAKNKSAAADGGPADGGSAQASASGPQMTTQLAESTGASLAKQRWPQYHPKIVSAQRIIGGYKVNIQMIEPVGAHVIIDMQGNYVDGGTSNGEH
jgi:hypothetical protein